MGMNSRASFSRQMHRPHLDAVRALGYTLTLGDQVAWKGFSELLGDLLEDEERAALAFWSLRSLSPEHAAMTMEAVSDLLGHQGPPLPPLMNPSDEAQWWASSASPEEIDTYAVACVASMSPARRRQFAAHLKDVG
ncbi:hypothetical protein [Salipiger thiooxidans]|uniref:hypothetical protein n=1 Tax=Salipiger thiooxidans TaxID=282683 RepID=UPI001CD1A059|nr:hypothetical protein [Salipiger thiooxidans]MCA0847208.1 hypothetical protein [Salipiger thiooxidans]